MEASDRLLRELSVELRAQGRADRLGLDAACACCGDTTLVHLNRLREHEVCGCCLALSQGKLLILEGHHLAGRSEGPVVDVCRNCHLELTELQRSWARALPFDTRLDRGLGDLVEVRRRHAKPHA